MRVESKEAVSTTAGAAARATSGDRRPLVKAGLRVFHLVDSLNIGGTENQMACVALRMQRNGHRVTVGCLRAEGPLLQLLQRAAIPVVEFRKGKTLISLNGISQGLHLAAFLSGRFDVVHAHDLWSTLLGVPAARLARVPVVISSRRYLADLEWYTTLRNRAVRFLYRLSTRVLVNSQAVREQLVSRDHVAPEKVRVVYNAVDVERFVGVKGTRNKLLPTIAERSKVIAVLANMYSRVKGHDCLISAARIVCEHEPDVIFLLIGDGPERPRLEAQARGAGLEKNIVFIGRRTDVPDLLACCDLSVLPSENEAFPNALLESMSADLPVVATAAGGSKEIIENEVNGLLVPPGNREELAAAVLRLLRNPKLAKRMAHAGQEHVRKRFSFDRLMAELDQLYKEPLGS
ncbi:MAG TPA: glycosyltransferase [Candidatus Angelobacter sp.]|nr:glycosyltransferase [Candidatus Angelobacter sp.]